MAALNRRDLKKRILDILSTISGLRVMYVQPRQNELSSGIIAYVNYTGSTRIAQFDRISVDRNLTYEITVRFERPASAGIHDQDEDTILDIVDSVYQAFELRPSLYIDDTSPEGFPGVLWGEGAVISDDTYQVPGEYGTHQVNFTLNVPFRDTKAGC